MRLALLLLLASTPALANDAHLTRAPMDAVAAGTRGCAAARALVTDSSMSLDEGRCKKLTSAKLDVGAADVYRVTDGDQQRFALEVTDGDGHRWISALDLDTGKHTPRLRAIEVGGKPAFALDIRSPGAREFLVCGEHAGAWSCASAEVGSEGRRCKATLSDDGAIHSTCDETVKVALR